MVFALSKDFTESSEKEKKDKMTEIMSLTFRNNSELIPGKLK